MSKFNILQSMQPGTLELKDRTEKAQTNNDFTIKEKQQTTNNDDNNNKLQQTIKQHHTHTQQIKYTGIHRDTQADRQKHTHTHIYLALRGTNGQV